MAHAELDISSEPSQLSEVREFVKEFCRTRRLLDEDDLGQLELAVNEAVANIIRHAHRGCADLRIQIHADTGGDGVILQLYYGGDAFDPTGVPPPVFDGSREGGFGIYMIARSVDQVQYSQDAQGRNCISLIKNSRRPAP
jgi:serine/threonine-protein kinase RsbW